MHYALMTIKNETINEQMLKFKENQTSDDYCYDPNSKWDNYGEGRRFARFFKKKDGTRSYISKIKDIDFEGMREEMEISAKNEYSFINNASMTDEEKIKSIERMFGFYKTEEEYVNERKEESFLPYAFLKDGGWFDVKRYSSHQEWVMEFHKIFNSLDVESELIILDCHI